jgi:hypothetical protein
MPDDGLDQLRDSDSIFLGAVGYPGVPDHVSLWGLLIPIRRTFQQYVNLRPVRLLEGISSPLKNPGKVDFCIVRENNEGEYSSAGGKKYEGTENEVVIQESIFTKKGVDRVMKFAFELANKRRKKITSATKSNGIVHTMPFWDQRFQEIGNDDDTPKESNVENNKNNDDSDDNKIPDVHIKKVDMDEVDKDIDNDFKNNSSEPFDMSKLSNLSMQDPQEVKNFETGIKDYVKNLIHHKGKFNKNSLPNLKFLSKANIMDTDTNVDNDDNDNEGDKNENTTKNINILKNNSESDDEKDDT